MRYFVGGEGPPLILVHGLGGAAANWTELAPLLVPNHRLLVPDLPGHGGSEALPAVSGLEPFADRVAALAAREGMLPAPVVGHSLGGAVVLRLALRHPDDVSAVVLAAAAGLSLGSIWGRQLQSVFSTVRPGRLAARWRGLVSRSLLLRRFVFGFVSRRRSRLADQRGCRGISRGATAAHGCRQRVAGVARGRPASGARGSALPGAGPLGSRRRAAAARRRVRVRAPVARTAARHSGLRASPHRRAP